MSHECHNRNRCFSLDRVVCVFAHKILRKCTELFAFSPRPHLSTWVRWSSESHLDLESKNDKAIRDTNQTKTKTTREIRLTTRDVFTVELYSFISERLLFYVVGERRNLTKKVSNQEGILSRRYLTKKVSNQEGISLYKTKKKSNIPILNSCYKKKRLRQKHPQERVYVFFERLLFYSPHNRDPRLNRLAVDPYLLTLPRSCDAPPSL